MGVDNSTKAPQFPILTPFGIGPLSYNPETPLFLESNYNSPHTLYSQPLFHPDHGAQEGEAMCSLHHGA